METQTIQVPFHGDNLFLVDHEGQPYVPMKPVVEGMGLTWQSQRTKLASNHRWGITEIVIPSEGGNQGMTCLPLRKLPGWLMTIHVNKVRPELREKITAYQNECDDVLWDYWTKGIAENPRARFAQTPGDVLTEEQAEVLRLMLKEAAEKLPKARQGGFIMQGWAKLKAHFKVSYRMIPRHEYTEAVSLLSRHIVSGDTVLLQPEQSNEFIALCHEQALQIAGAIARQIMPDLLSRQQPDLRFIRMMFTIDHAGKPSIYPLEQGSIITSAASLSKDISDPGCIHMSNEQLAAIATACTSRLEHRFLTQKTM